MPFVSYTHLGELTGVGFAFVAKHVVLVDNHERFG